VEFASVAKKDLKPLADLIRASAPGYDFLDASVLDGQIFGDPGYDASFVLQALEKGKPIGFLLGVARRQGEKRDGHIKFFCVHPKHRGKKIGNELFSEVERRFQKREAHDIHIGLCPFPYLITGVDSSDTSTVCFLLSRGYSQDGEAVDMTCDLGKLDFAGSKEDQALAKQMRVHRVKKEEWDKTFAAIRTKWPWWQPEIRAALDKGVAFAAEENGQAIAFAVSEPSNPGWFGPMGTLEAARGKGLGRILLLKCLETIKKNGSKQATITWVGPIAFYAKHCKARISRVNWHFLKRV
jgi:ribosomal protein S18 acetylase RimI-like enzyme